MTKTEKVISGLLQHGRTNILNYFKPNSCIASSRIALSVLQEFQIPSFELPVQVTILNNLFRKFLVDHKRWPGGPEIKELMDEGGYSLGIGFGPNKTDSDDWDGHLVVIAQDKDKNCKYLIDLSIDQSSRPNYGIKLKPLAWPVDEKFIKNLEISVIDLFYQKECACSIFYYSKPDFKNYKNSNNWDKKSTMFITNLIVEKIKNDMENL